VPVPSFLGARRVDVPIADLMPFIAGRSSSRRGSSAGHLQSPAVRPRRPASCTTNAQELLQRVAADGSLRAAGIYGFLAGGERRRRHTDASRATERLRFNMLRQQEVIADDKPNRSLADFVAPIGSGVEDHVGAFAVTAGLGADELAAAFGREHDDYRAIMVKALADRLAEAFAEYLHAEARRQWGYGRDERLTNDDLVAEKYRGIRPAFGYPACPDHSEKVKLFDLLDAPGVGIHLTESCAMLPAASVSGLYFAHPRARYFMVGRLGEDQVTDYARRKGMSVEETEKWLSPNLAYERQAV
jgi:5-methyltetrahydrofolate--homocysteine methyltransferase